MIPRGFIPAGRVIASETRKQLGKAGHSLASGLLPSHSATAYRFPAARFSSTGQPESMIERATHSLKGRKKIAELNRLNAIRKVKNAAISDLELSLGIGFFSLFKKYTFYKELQDPTKINQLATYLIVAKGKMGGLWNSFETNLRKKIRVKKEEGDQADHVVSIADVSLKLLIHVLQNGMPTREEFDVIYENLNSLRNIRKIPDTLHEVITDIGRHTLTGDKRRMITMEEAIQTLPSEKKSILEVYLRKEGKTFSQIQNEYCNSFTDELKKRKTPFLVSFAENFKDFYLNHRIGNVQRGGGATFTQSEQKLLVVILELLGPAVDAQNDTPTASTKEESSKEEKTKINAAYDNLNAMKNVIASLFKNVRKLYESKNNLSRFSALPENNGANVITRRRNQRSLQLMGGRTFKKRR
jgi:hypothetical protein